MNFRSLLRVDIPKNRIYGLDILRAMAILFVMIEHGTHYLPKGLPQEISSLLVFDGVSIFFVLSGFLIGNILLSILQKEGLSVQNLLRFWYRRWMRTLPNYFVVLSGLIVLHFIFNDHRDHPFEGGWHVFWKYYLFIQNVAWTHPNFFPEAWSLSIEEWFYFLVPILLFLFIYYCNYKIKPTILLLAFSIILAATLFRYFQYITIPNSLDQWGLLYKKQVITRLDSLMFGILGAYIYYFNLDFWNKYKLELLIAGIGLHLLHRYWWFADEGIHFPLYTCVFSFTVLSIATLFLLPFLSNKIGKNGSIYKSITTISLLSYSMYLINLSLVQLYTVNFVEKYISSQAYFLYSCFWGITIFGSLLLYKYIELPILQLRDKKK